MAQPKMIAKHTVYKILLLLGIDHSYGGMQCMKEGFGSSRVVVICIKEFYSVYITVCRPY